MVQGRSDRRVQLRDALHPAQPSQGEPLRPQRTHNTTRGGGLGIKIGYARVSTARQGQSFDTQRDALMDVGCDAARLHSDTISGTKWSRPGLTDALTYMRPGDTLVVTVSTG
ncbi:MAG: recombinase family protein [Actinomyces sp. oral taxon 181]|nr:recombinase family protein [Actinomyces sp. oral taxon 181]